MAIIQHSSETVEHYTPAHIIEAAKRCMGGIDLDPASCTLAQQVVQAEVWYGPDSPFGEDGLEEPWIGRVFLNPPGGKVDAEGRPVFLGCGKPTAPNAGMCGLATPHKHVDVISSAAYWWAWLATKWETGEVDQGVFVGFSLEILRSTQQLPVPQPLTFPFCVPEQRIAFDTLGEDGNRVSSHSPTNANVLIWLPPKQGTWTHKALAQHFQLAFGGIGHCVIPCEGWDGY